MKRTSPQHYKALNGKKPGSASFNSAWKSLAAKDPKGFDAAQHSFIKATHFTPAATSIKNTLGIDVTKRSKAVQDVLWSTATQHGPGGAQKVFKGAGVNSKMSDAEIIKRVYAERGASNGMKYFRSSSPGIRKGVVNRFKNEMKDALSMLK